MKKRLGVIFVIAVLATHATAQQSFDVISVKPNDSTSPSDLRISPQRFSCINATLRQLIQVAYDVRPYQLTSLPAWADSAHFDVAATTGVPASPWLWAQPFLLTFIGGVFADAYEGPRPRLALAAGASILLLQVVFCVLSLPGLL